VGIYLEEDRVKKITYKLTAMILETCDPVSGLNKLSLRDQGSTVCGRIFTRGEYLYSCKDCGVDPTCVMCPACFNASEHVNCRYRVSRSGGGGGTCDCGDVEAWKNHPTCRNHMKKEQVEVSESDKMLRIRIKRLFSQILRLAVELLYDNVCTTNCLSEKLRKIVENTDLSAVANTYSTNNECSLILYNDEVHSYDQVERMLKESVNATAEQAHIYATHIDKKGRTSLKTGARADCEEVFKIIRFDGKDKLPKIKLLVIDSNILELQEVTYRLLSWMNWLAGQGEIFRSAFCDAYLSSGFYPRRNSLEDTTTPFITHIMISDIHTWKAVRSIMMKNLLETMLKDPENKMKVAEIFTDHYHKIYDNFFYKDDHDQQFSSSSISVQIFTTPTVVKELMHSHGLFEKIGKMTYDWYFPINEKSGMRELKILTDRKPGNRAQCYPIDITYILHNPPSSDDENLRTVVKDGIFWLLEMFRLFEARDGVKWSHKNHVEHEPDWENLMTFIFSVQSTYTRLLQWAHRDEFVADYCISTILERYLQKTDDEFPPKSYDRNVLNEKFNFIPIDVQTKKVHIYNMYSRIFTHCISSPEISSRYNSHQIAYR
jgi:E3 ubiquitin-protein ligase UBR2